jgi:hypothetical protein
VKEGEQSKPDFTKVPKLKNRMQYFDFAHLPSSKYQNQKNRVPKLQK